MALFAPIPMPSVNNEAFKDVMDYMETLRKRQALTQQAQQEMQQKQSQFNETKAFEREKMNLQNEMDKAKLAELAKYHQAKLSNEGGNGLPKLSAQERTQAMKLLEAGRTLKGVNQKALELEEMLETNPHLTGWGQGFKSLLSMPGKDTGSFIEKAGNLQAAIGRLASQRGGAQVLKWAAKVKPSEWKDIKSNLGMTSSILGDTGADFDEIKNEYEALTGRSYPHQLSPRKKYVTVKDKLTGKITRMSEEKYKELIANESGQ